MRKPNKVLLTKVHVSRRCYEAGVLLSPAGVRFAADRGEIPFIETPSKQRLFTESDADRFIEKRLVEKCRRQLEAVAGNDAA